ncbi:MAG: hypothetical protein EZS28_035588, partial [Streblomastix strix]
MIKQLIRIRRVIEKRDLQTVIQLINAGLMEIFSEMIEKSISYDDGLDIIEIITDVLKRYFFINERICQQIFDQTDFFNQCITMFKTVPLNKANNKLLSALVYITSNERPVNNNLKMYEAGIIQTMFKFVYMLNKGVQDKVVDIICNVVATGLKDLKEGQQNPFREQLYKD